MAEIELVIKIDEEEYKFAKKQVSDGITNPLKICIANGTPLSKWIPVSERLPELNVEVLATTRCGECGAVTIAQRYNENDWWICEGNLEAETDEIFAWMPLPEPYKADKE